MDKASLEQATLQIGKEIFQNLEEEEPRFWESRWWEQKTIEWLTSDKEIKNRVLQFIDVFPSLRTSRSIARHLGEYLPDSILRSPRELRIGKYAVESALMTPGAAAAAARFAVTRIAKQFIAGATPEQTALTLNTILNTGMSYTLDLLGEATLSEKESDVYTDKYVSLIKFLAAGRTQGDPEVNVSVKLSSLTPRFNAIAPEEASKEARARLGKIMRAAVETGSRVNIDMEQFALRDLTLCVVRDILCEKEFEDFRGAGVVAQAYLKDAEESLEKTLQWARDHNLTIRLVKGAYWDHEVITSRQRNWEPPVLLQKAETDAAFERMTVTLMKESDSIIVGVASHNIRSIAKAIATARALDVPADRFEIQMLYGMADPVKNALVNMGIPVRVYAPFGETIPGMAYLVRRILENSSNESFLKRSFVEHQPEDKLMEDPASLVEPQKSVAELDKGKSGARFVNEPEIKFHDQVTRDTLNMAIELVKRKLGERYACVVNGRRILTDACFNSVDPSGPDRIVGIVSKAGPPLADEAMRSAARAFESWSGVSPDKRCELLLQAASIVRERKLELAAWEMVETGKTRQEAVADVNETIDHMEFYARAGRTLARERLTERNLFGETNTMAYRPRGAGVVISPWNFPLAILAGMTCSALAGGNTVTIKPASNAAVTAALFCDIVDEAGLPEGVVNFLPGPGDALGPALIDHPATSFALFTGSWEVGSSIMERAGKTSRTRDGFIKVIAEMGGKNAIIVDESADLDQAVSGVIASAFGFGGQKCSACSRVIVIRSVYDQFARRLVDAAAGLVVGPALEASTQMGPLIDETAMRKTESYIALGAEEGTALLIREPPDSNGYFVGPAIFGDVDPDGKLAMEEIFGPVLSLFRVDTIDQAINLANNSSYALTGGIYSRTPSSIAKVKDGMEAGNLYINRTITGALVGRQPFGGFKKSGTGSAKAGSVDVVRELMVPRCVSENNVRHGFSPDLDS